MGLITQVGVVVWELWTFIWPLVSMQDLDFSTDSQSWILIWSSTVTGSGYLHCPIGSISLRHQHRPLSLVSAQCLMVTESWDMSIDPGCIRCMDLDRDLVCIFYLNVTMDSEWQCRRLRSGCFLVLGLEPKLMWLIWPQASSWHLVATEAPFVNPVSGCYGAQTYQSLSLLYLG